MDRRNGERVVHSYDTERRRVLCGLTEQTNSTKHAAAVTCTTCRELLDARERLVRAEPASPSSQI